MSYSDYYELMTTVGSASLERASFRSRARPLPRLRLRVSPAGGERLRRISEPDQGFGLVEVLIAFAMTAIAFLAIGQTVVGSIALTKQSAFTTTATLLARQKIEELRGLPYDDSGLAAVSPDAPQEDPVPDYPDMTRQWIIEDDLPYAGVKRITVTVSSRRSAVGGIRTITLASFRISSLVGEPVTQ